MRIQMTKYELVKLSAILMVCLLGIVPVGRVRKVSAQDSTNLPDVRPLAFTQQVKLSANDGIANDNFGNAVAITGDVIVVGAHHADLPGNSSAGAAYVFLRTGTVWAQTQRLSPSLNVLLGDIFGDSVAIGGNKIVIGASGDDTPFTSAGAVYVFVETGTATYTFQQKLTIPDGSNGDQFGFSEIGRAHV